MTLVEDQSLAIYRSARHASKLFDRVVKILHCQLIYKSGRLEGSNRRKYSDLIYPG
jgi:hypothetical protein